MENENQKLRAELEELKASVLALHLSLASALALAAHKLPSSKEKLDSMESDILTRTIADLMRSDVPPELGPQIRQEVSRLFRRARRNLGFPS